MVTRSVTRRVAIQRTSCRRSSYVAGGRMQLTMARLDRVVSLPVRRGTATNSVAAMVGVLMCTVRRRSTPVHLRSRRCAIRRRPESYRRSASPIVHALGFVDDRRSNDREGSFEGDLTTSETAAEVNVGAEITSFRLRPSTKELKLSDHPGRTSKLVTTRMRSAISRR